MSQRNPLNERYTVERQGQTRKSAASAKPKSERAATLRDPAPKSRKQKKKERQEREAKARKRAYEINARYEDTQEYRHLRHVWWGGLIAAIACTALSFCMTTYPDFFTPFIPENIFYSISLIIMIGAYAFIIFAFYIDFSKIRKGRKAFEQRALYDNSKEARALQKKARAEAREREREAAAKAKEEAQNPPEKPKGFFDRFKRKDRSQAEAPSQTEDQAEATEAAKAEEPVKVKGQAKAEDAVTIEEPAPSEDAEATASAENDQAAPSEDAAGTNPATSN